MGKHGARKFLVPGFSEKLGIPDELVECFDSGDSGSRMTAFVVSPFGTKVWLVEVGRDGEGAFLGRRWPEFVEAHGIGVGWFLVLRHEGRGVLTVKAFDDTSVIKEFGQTITVPGLPAAKTETGRARRPQFIMPLCHDWMEKMPIPAEFLKRGYISDEDLNRRMATFVMPFRHFWHIDLEKDGSNVFFAGDWSKFLEFQGIIEGEVLLVRYQGNMIFTIEVYGFTGCRRKLENHGIRFQQTENSENTNSCKEIEQSGEANTSQRTEQSEEETEQSEEENSSYRTEQSEEANSSQKNAQSSEAQRQKEAHISSSKRKRNEEQKMPKNSTNSTDRRRRVNEIQPRLSTTKQITKYVIKNYLTLPVWFCENLGLQENCNITLNSLASKSTWEVGALVNKRGECLLSRGWKIFCRDNRLKEGDACTFNVVNSKLWRVHIERC